MKKTTAILLAVFLLAAVLVACSAPQDTADETVIGGADGPTDIEVTDEPEAAESDWAGIEAEGKMVIGYTVYDPMNYFDADGNFVGFDTEYAEAVCDYLGIEADFVEIEWATKEVELAAGNIDAIWNGLTVTEDRKANMLFTETYMENKQVIVISEANADKYKSTADLSSATRAAEAGSTGEETIMSNEDLASCNFVGVTKMSDALLEVKAGTSDAAVVDFTTADARVGEGPDYSDLMVIDGVDLAIEDYAVGCRLGSDLAEKINEATAALYEDGTMATLAEKYGLSALLVK